MKYPYVFQDKNLGNVTLFYSFTHLFHADIVEVSWILLSPSVLSLLPDPM